MDTAKSLDSGLKSLPPDIWAYFVCYLSGEQLGRLMITGAAFLWERLKFPKVVKSIQIGKDFVVFKSCPRFLKEFSSLEELSIHSCNDGWSCKLGLTLDSIPSGVRKLELSGEFNEWTDMLFGEHGVTLKLNENLPHLEALDLNSVKFSSYTWMTHSPQSLTKLNLYRWDGTVELPTLLTHFEANIVALSSRSFVSKLPSSLESFVASSLSGLDLIFPLLPSSTRELHLGYQPNYCVAPSPGSVDINFQIVPKLASLLPATLTELNIDPIFPCTAWHLLPRYVATLSFQALRDLYTVASNIFEDHGGHQVKSIPFDSFPKSITSLSFLFDSYLEHYFCGPPRTPNHSFFPPQLTVLKIRNVQLSPETAKLLPSSLTHLELGNFGERVCEHLPTGLKILMSSQALLSPNLIKFLPKSLTFLHLSHHNGSYPWFDFITGEEISISNLPEYSIHKLCVSNTFDWKNHPSLPPTLTYFHLTNDEELGDSFVLHQQLPNLRDLRMGLSKHFSDLSIPLLSRQLATLDLSSSSNVSGKSFPFLPRCLSFLNLDSSESIFDSEIQHLPRTLKEAHLRRAIHLTDLCVPDLPPHMETLALSDNCGITPACYPYLPYPLRYAQQFSNAYFEESDTVFEELDTDLDADLWNGPL